MYAKTHSNIPAGVQKQRDYDWPVDPTKNSFGFGEKFQPNQAARAVHSERFDGGYPKTVIVQKTVEDVKAVASDQLGVPKNLGQGKPPISDDFVFGVPSQKKDQEWNAAKCLMGEPSLKELVPDSDLGKCTKPGSRNIVRRPQDADRAFGCPSVRTDIPMKQFKSVADH